MTGRDLSQPQTQQLAVDLSGAMLASQDGNRLFDDDQILLCLLDLHTDAGQDANDAGVASLLMLLTARAGAGGLHREAAEAKIRSYREAHVIPASMRQVVAGVVRSARAARAGSVSKLSQALIGASTSSPPVDQEPLELSKSPLFTRLSNTTGKQ